MKTLTGKAQAARITGVNLRTLHRWVKNGKIEEYFIKGTALQRKTGLVCIEEIKHQL
ncbi:MAG: hypothetical protein AAFN93_21050 [Bacteroidota bacterium]